MNIFKKVLIIVIIIFAIWFFILIMNLIRCKQLKTPIFLNTIYLMEMVEYKDNNGEIQMYNPREYDGIGYNIKCKVKDEEIIESKMYLFNFLICESSVIQ